MNQSNQSLQVSKNDSFSEQNQTNQDHTDYRSQITSRSARISYDVEVFRVGTEREILSNGFALREHAEQWANEFDPDCCQELFLHSFTCLYGSEFSRDRQRLLCDVIGATRGQYFVVQGGNDLIVKNQLISPALQSREQADAWRQTSLPYYPDCHVFEHEAVLDGDGPDLQDECNLLAGNHITAYAVVHGGDGELRCLPIGDRYFTTEAQARRYQSEILPEYPSCQISPQNFHFEDARQRLKLLEHLFGQLKAEIAADLSNCLTPGWLNTYRVVCGGNGPYQLAPIVPYAQFRTLAEAEKFKANVSLDYPDCRVSHMGYATPKNELELNEFINSIFYKDFELIAHTDFVDLKVQRGNILLMRRGISPQEGDIIAIGHGDDLCRRIAHYQPELEQECFAVCVSIMTSKEQSYRIKEVA